MVPVVIACAWIRRWSRQGVTAAVAMAVAVAVAVAVYNSLMLHTIQLLF